MAEWSKVEVNGEEYRRLPIRTHVITEADDIARVADEATARLREPGDIIVVSESVVAAAQGRTIPAERIRPGMMARILWRFVRKVPYGTGLRSPLSMQCAIEEVGAWRIVLASIAGALGKLVGRRGDFYRVAGMQAALIDAAYTSGISRYHDCVILGPREPESVACEIAERTGVDVAIMDINDVGGSWVIGASKGVNRAVLEAVMRDNPLGQGDEQTPIGIVRPCRRGQAEREGTAGRVSAAQKQEGGRGCALARSCAWAATLVWAIGSVTAVAQPSRAGSGAVAPPVSAGELQAPGPRPTGEPARGGGEEESEEEARRAQAVRLVNRARDLNRSGNWRQAVDLLRVAAATDPSYSQPHRWLGYIYEQQYDRATKGEQRGEFQRKAIAAYAKALSIKRDAEFVEPHMARLFFARDFPRVLDAESVPYAPARFAIGSALLVPPDAPESEPVRGGYAYTVSVVYPPESKDATGIEVWPRSPRGGMRYGRASAEAQERFNRVSYGFTLQPREGVYTLQFVAHYASEALQLRSVGVEALAARVMGALLHFYWYSVVYLGVQPVDVSDVWLSQYSEAGAAQTGEDILINDIGTPREPIEWLREVAHEYGHLVLPRIGDFVEPDDTGSGVLGERLFLAWLADEAERVAGGKWPASSVQSAANAMWGGEDVAVESFVANHCDEPLVFWLLHGPKSELASGRSREALEWLTGLALYVEAAHGAPMLAQAFRDTEGEGPEDFLRGCQRAVERRLEVGALHVKPAVFIPGASEADTAGYHRLGSSAGVQLPPDGRAAYWVYLPTGSWTCRVRAQSEGDVTLGVALDGAASSGLVIRAGDGSGEAALRDVQGGWHRLVISVANAEGEVMLEDIAIGEAG